MKYYRWLISLLSISAIGYWVYLSTRTWMANDPLEFQRAGAFGVAIMLLVAAVLVSYISLISKEMTNLELDQAASDRRKLFRINSTISGSMHVLSELEDAPNQEDRLKVKERLQEVLSDISDLNNAAADSSSALEDRILSVRSRISRMELQASVFQLFPMCLATLQWGYGDKLHCFANGVGWTSCG